MVYFDQFIIIAIAHILALMSPGPDFAIILKQSITYGRKKSIWTSFGISIGILVHVTYTILGV
ncbi:lysine transporter LysE, partial [Malaciobacter mytili]